MGGDDWWTFTATCAVVWRYCIYWVRVTFVRHGLCARARALVLVLGGSVSLLLLLDNAMYSFVCLSLFSFREWHALCCRLSFCVAPSVPGALFLALRLLLCSRCHSPSPERLASGRNPAARQPVGVLAVPPPHARPCSLTRAARIGSARLSLLQALWGDPCAEVVAQLSTRPI